jgi:hypothetical protein
LRERAEPPFEGDQMEKSGGDRFLRESARRREAGSRERGEREAIGEGIERHPPEAEERAPFGSELPEEVIGGLERGRDHEGGTAGRDSGEPAPGLLPSRGGLRRDDDAVRHFVSSNISLDSAGMIGFSRV